MPYLLTYLTYNWGVELTKWLEMGGAFSSLVSDLSNYLWLQKIFSPKWEVHPDLLESNLRIWSSPLVPTWPWFCWAPSLHSPQRLLSHLAFPRTKMDLGKDNQPRQRSCISYYLTFHAKWVREALARLPTKFSEKNTPCWLYIVSKLIMNSVWGYH